MTTPAAYPDLTLPAPTRVLGLSTPRLIQVSMGMLILSTLIAWATAASAVLDSRHAIQVIGHDTTPSIVAALKIRTSLADLDANEAVLFLCKPDSSEYAASQSIIHDRLEDIGDNIITAAQNINHGDAERIPVIAIEDGLAQYQDTMARAHLLQRFHHDDEALATFREATRQMHERLLSAADDLCSADRTELQTTYDRQHWIANSSLFRQIIIATILIAQLLWIQWFLSRRTHRRINLCLLAAMALTFLVQVSTTIQVLRGEEDLRVMKADAFDSIYALHEARAISFDLGGDETRWLFDPTPANERAYFKKVDMVLNPSADMTIEQVAASNLQTPPTACRGYLIDELRNITFVGEQQAAEDAVKAFALYHGIDAKLRQFEKDQNHAAAVALDVNSSAGSPRNALTRFDAAMINVIGINQNAFDHAMAQGFSDLIDFDWELPLTTGVVIALVYFGLRPRLREYAG